MTKYKGILKKSFTVEASDPREALQKIKWLINEGEEDLYGHVVVREV